MLFCVLPLTAATPGVSSQQVELMESRYAFWFQGDFRLAQTHFQRIYSHSPEVAWHEADMCLSLNNEKAAFDALMKVLPYSHSEVREALVQRVYDFKPTYQMPLIQGNNIFIPVYYVKENGKQLWTIKEGIPLLMESNAQGQLVSLKIHRITGKGAVAKRIGFNIGDRIFSLDGKSVGDWAKFEVLPFFSRAAQAGTKISVEMIPRGQTKKIKKVFHIVDDLEVIQQHVESEKRTK